MLVGSLMTYFAWSYGYLRFVPELLGRSSDLTGRDVSWTIAMDVFDSSGVTLTGGGYAVGLQRMLPEFVYVDNGYYDILMQLGYAGSAIVVAFVCWIVVAAKKLIVRAPRELAMISIFPLAIAAVLAVLNISEAVFLSSKNFCTIFTVMAVATIVRMRDEMTAVEKPTESLVRPGTMALELAGSPRQIRSTQYAD
jgi:O-antigen ligase